MTTHAALVLYLAQTHQPVSYVAECAKIPQPKLARFATNEGPLTGKERERLTVFLNERHPGWRRWVNRWTVSASTLAAGALTAASNAAVQQWVKSLFDATK